MLAGIRLGRDAGLSRTPAGRLLHVVGVDVATGAAQSPCSRCASCLRRVYFGRKLRGGCFPPAAGAGCSVIRHCGLFWTRDVKK
jgi:hypothetical protein